MPNRIFFNQSELRAGWRFCLYLIMAVALIWGWSWVVRKLFASQLAANAFSPQLIMLNDAVLLISVVVPALIMGRVERRTLGDYGLPAQGAFGRRMWEGVAWGVAIQAFIIFLLVATGTAHIAGSAIGGVVALKFAVLWAIAFLLVGFAEEFAFRGYSQFTLTTGIGFWPAATLLTLIFAAVHLGNGGENWVGAAGVFMAGMVLALPLRRTGALWFSVGLHAGFDWAESYLFGVADSGTHAQGYLLNTSFTGSKWLTGGTVGPEASVITFGVLALVLVLIHLRFPGVHYPRAGAARALFEPTLAPNKAARGWPTEPREIL